MANNNECALSQASGYTSNSNSTDIFGLNPIEGIELNSGQYGVDLSGRLADINENFNKIIESDFLRGAPGRSISISTWVFNDETKETPMGQSLVDAIMSNNLGQESNALKSSIIDGLNNKEIKVIYDEAGTIVSSLPFTFIDKRFYDGKTLDKNLANETDLSCVLVYETTTNSGGFVAAQTFPTLYWDAGLDGGNFCWKINGQKTGLPCKGPQGNDGSGGTLYTVIYDPTVKNVSNGSSACEIVGVMWLNSSNVSDIKNEFIPKTQFKEKQISIKTGDTVIAIPGSILEDGTVLFTPPSNSSIGTTITSDTTTYEYSITTVFVTNEDNYYVVISGDTIHIPYVLSGGTLDSLMSKLGENYMLGLYIPSEKLNGLVTKAHTLWTDRKNSSNFCIGEVANPAEMKEWSENPGLVDDPSSVSLLYDKVSVGKDIDGTKAVTKITSNLITDIVEMYPESSQYQTIEVDRFDKGYLIDKIFKTSYRVIGREYDFYSTYNSREKSYFGIYQPVKIGEVWRYAAQITSSTGQIFYILWGGLNDFISLLSKWYDCINQENGNSFPVLHQVEIVELNNLRVEDNDWVCDSYTYYNTSNIEWEVVYQNRHNLSIKQVICDNVYISGRNTMNFTYTGKDDDGVTYELRSRILTVDKNEPCILPIDIYEDNDFQHCVPFVIARFANFPIKVENVDVIPEGKNSFDVHATFNVRHQYYRPYYHGARLHEKYHQYEGDFDQYYKVKAGDVNAEATNINVEATNINVEATNINVEATESHIKSAQHRVGHTPYINGSTNNLVSFRGVTIHPTIRRLHLTDELGEILEYDLYIPLCAMKCDTLPGYASVYKMKPNGGTRIPACLILWSKLEVNIISFYKKYYKIQTSTDPIAVPVLELTDFESLGITMYESDIDEPYNQFVPDMTHPIASDEEFKLGGSYPSYQDQKTFAREDVSIYTDRIEWVERDPHSNPHKRYTINVSPDNMKSRIELGYAFFIAKDINETRSQDPSKYVIIMCGNSRQAYPISESLGETYSNHPSFMSFRDIYKYDESGQDGFNKVLIINRADKALPATNSSCETWQEKVTTRGSEIRNDCGAYSIYCHQFFVNGIDIVPLLPKLQELVSSSNS